MQITLLFCELHPQDSVCMHNYVSSVLRGCVAAPLTQGAALSYSSAQAPGAAPGKVTSFLLATRQIRALEWLCLLAWGAAVHNAAGLRCFC